MDVVVYEGFQVAPDLVAKAVLLHLEFALVGRHLSGQVPNAIARELREGNVRRELAEVQHVGVNEHHGVVFEVVTSIGLSPKNEMVVDLDLPEREQHQIEVCGTLEIASNFVSHVIFIIAGLDHLSDDTERVVLLHYLRNVDGLVVPELQDQVPPQELSELGVIHLAAHCHVDHEMGCDGPSVVVDANYFLDVCPRVDWNEVGVAVFLVAEH